jgi:glutamate N-acetyltransferase/amino-acid N-acetyltransferase
LREAVAQSFNRITVDGDMSTNDTVLVLANGMAGNRNIEHRTSNAELSMTGLHASPEHSMFRVRCLMFDVPAMS